MHRADRVARSGQRWAACVLLNLAQVSSLAPFAKGVFMTAVTGTVPN